MSTATWAWTGVVPIDDTALAITNTGGPIGAEVVTLSLLVYGRSIAVTLAALLQLLIAVTFLIMPVLVLRHGTYAQAAAEAEVVSQGFPADVLARNKIHFDEGTAGLVLPIVIALTLGTLAVLNLAGSEVGRNLSLIFQPVLLVGGGFITFRQVTAARFVQTAFEKSGDPMLTAIDVQAFVDAATDAFPRGFLFLVRARFILVTLGSMLVIVLLVLPSATAFR
jgi:hypothetical protein